MRVLDVFEKRSYETEQSHNKKSKETTWTWEICKKVAGLYKTETLGHGSYTGKRSDAAKSARSQAKQLGGSICNFRDGTF